MRILVLLYIFFSGSVQGQETYTITFGQNEPKTKSNFDILIGCGVAGTVSYQLTLTKELIINKNYSLIKKNLYSNDLLLQLTSVIALEELSNHNPIFLSARESQVISQIKRSKKTYYFCNGCTGHYYGTIADIFAHDTKDKSLLNISRNIKCEIGLENY